MFTSFILMPLFFFLLVSLLINVIFPDLLDLASVFLSASACSSDVCPLVTAGGIGVSSALISSRFDRVTFPAGGLSNLHLLSGVGGDLSSPPFLLPGLKDLTGLGGADDDFLDGVGGRGDDVVGLTLSVVRGEQAVDRVVRGEEVSVRRSASNTCLAESMACLMSSNGVVGWLLPLGELELLFLATCCLEAAGESDRLLRELFRPLIVMPLRNVSLDPH